jgi:hypothetical protein
MIENSRDDRLRARGAYLSYSDDAVDPRQLRCAGGGCEGAEARPARSGPRAGQPSYGQEIAIETTSLETDTGFGDCGVRRSSPRDPPSSELAGAESGELSYVAHAPTSPDIAHLDREFTTDTLDAADSRPLTAPRSALNQSPQYVRRRIAGFETSFR